jgi:hypothetical protein
VKETYNLDSLQSASAPQLKMGLLLHVGVPFALNFFSCFYAMDLCCFCCWVRENGSVPEEDSSSIYMSVSVDKNTVRV